MTLENASERKPCDIWIDLNGEAKFDQFCEVRNTWRWESEEFEIILPSFDGNNFDASQIFTGRLHQVEISMKFSFSKLEGRSVLKRLTTMYLNQKDCDVQFKIGNQQIGGHVSILSAASPVFAVMFKHDTLESKTRQVAIEDISMDIFKMLLYYIYSGRLSRLTEEDTAKMLFEAAHKYNIVDLMEECVDFIVDSIRVDNVLPFISWAHIYLFDKLTNSILDFIRQHAQKIYEQESWEKFIKDQPDLTVIVTRHTVKRPSTLLSHRGSGRR